MIKRGVRKHHIDIIFLMILFLIFTFSAVSALLLAINSYRSVVKASESQASARVLSSYIREVVRQHDENGGVYVDTMDGTVGIHVDEGDDYFIFIYASDGYLMELNASAYAGATLDFGTKIAAVSDFDAVQVGNLITVSLSDDYGNQEKVDIAVKSETYIQLDDPIGYVFSEEVMDEAEKEMSSEDSGLTEGDEMTSEDTSLTAGEENDEE